MDIVNGAVYLVRHSPSWEYLTIGQTYKAAVSDDYVNLHRVDTGAGTFVKRRYIDDGTIVLERVYGATDIAGMVVMEPQPNKAQLALAMPAAPSDGYSPYVDPSGLWYWRKLASDLVSLPVQQY